MDLLEKPRERHAPGAARRMKAAVVTGPRRLALREVARPEPGAGQVRVRLEGCGVCASNLVPWEGAEWMRYPTEPGGLGHEGWGIVDAVAPDVSGIAVGDRVATLFSNAYAEYDLGDADAVVKLPDSLAGKPFPGEPLGCAMNIFRRTALGAGETVAIIGIGFLGALLTRLAVHAGARVVAVSQRAFSRDLALRMGASEALPLGDPGAVTDAVRRVSGGGLCDRVIEATGKQGPLDLAGDLVREGGRLVIAGYHQDGSRRVNMQQWNWKGIDVINAHERERAAYANGIRRAIAAVEAGIIQPEPLYTHTYPLERLADALEATRERPDGFVKALVRF